MNTEATYNLIEKYLNDALTPAEKAAVEARCKNDVSFCQEVEAHRIANSIIADNVSLDIKKQLRKIHAENTSSKKFNYRRLYWGLAAIATLSLLSVFVLQKPEKPVVNNISQQVVNEDSTVHTHEQVNKEIVKNAPSNKDTDDKSPAATNIKEEVQTSLNAGEISKEDEKVVVEQDKLKEGKDNRVNNVSRKENTKNSNPEKQVAEDLCEGIVIDINFSVINTCSGQKRGAIIFDPGTMEGAEFSIDGGKTFFIHNRFDNLSIGNYPLVVMNPQRCKSKTVLAQVEKEICDYVIYPQQQRYWEVPLSKFDGEAVRLKIMDGKSGRVVYTQEISGFFTWTGIDNNGTELPMGIYAYELSAIGMSSNLIINGTVTITR